MNSNNAKSGFSLVELLVATSLFILVVSIASASVLSMLAATKQVKSSQSVMDELEFIMEELTRNLRTGSNYFCYQFYSYLNATTDTSDCESNSPGSVIAFVPQSGVSKVVYSFNNNQLKRSINNGVGTYQSMNSDNLLIKDFNVLAFGTDRSINGNRNDVIQPRVVITIIATDSQGNNETTVSTSITQRKLDYEN